MQVVNTDAEGRLTMADALWYAEHKLNATAIVNIATLTGAMIVSLGTGIAGLFSPNDDIADRCVHSHHVQQQCPSHCQVAWSGQGYRRKAVAHAAGGKLR